MKEYLDYENGDIISSNDGNYFDDDFDLEGVSDVTENDDYINYTQENETFENIVIDDDYNPDYLNTLNVSEKKYLEGDYVYKEEVLKEKEVKIKPKKIKKKKREKRFYFIDIFNTFFKFILFLFRILFLLIIMLSVLFFILWDGQKYDEQKDEEKLSSSQDIIVESLVSDLQEENPNEYNNFVLFIQSYLGDLTEIINGENLIIDNLNKSIITDKDAYNYFNKTLIRKGELLNELNNYSFPEEVSTVVALVKQMTINSENLSKQVMNRYLVKDGPSKMIDDMNAFYNKFLTDCDLVSKYLGNM